MKESPISGTRWFALSGRELIVLATAVAIVLAAVAATRGLDMVFKRSEIRISEDGDVVPAPARLDVNTAAEHELALLPGIGPKTAQAIVRYRDEHGPFPSLEDLTKVSGIGPKTLEGIRPYAMCARPKAAPQ